MNVRRLKVCMLTAVAVGVTAADASAFGGRLFGNRGGAGCDPCGATAPAASPCGGSASAMASGTTGGCSTAAPAAATPSAKAGRTVQVNWAG